MHIHDISIVQSTEDVENIKLKFHGTVLPEMEIEKREKLLLIGKSQL